MLVPFARAPCNGFNHSALIALSFAFNSFAYNGFAFSFLPLAPLPLARMSFEEWQATVPECIKRDKLWEFVAYQKALWLYDLAWDDCDQLMKDIRGRGNADQARGKRQGAKGHESN